MEDSLSFPFSSFSSSSSAGSSQELFDFLRQLCRREHTPFCDNPRDQTGRSYIEGWVPATDTRRGYPVLPHVRHLPVRTLLDYYVVATTDRQVDRGERCSDVERNFVMMRHHRNLIGSNFVCRISIGGHPICSHDYGCNVPGAQQCCHHTVQNESRWQFIVHEFEGG